VDSSAEGNSALRQPALKFIFITLLLDILGIGIIVPILPGLVKELLQGGVSDAAKVYGILGALYALMQFIFSPMLGALSDRFGRRPVILTALFGSGLDYFLLAFAPTLAWFVVGRIIAGITAANFSAATAYIADISPPEKRAANFGLVGAAFGLGFAIGPALGGLLGQTDLRLPFIVAGVLTLLNWLYGYFVLPESLPPEKRRSFSIARCNPITALISLRSRSIVMWLAVIYLLYQISHQVYPAIWALYTENRYGWTPRQIGMSLAFVGVLAAIVQGGLTRRIMPFLGERRAVIVGLVVTMVAYLAYGIAPEGWMVYAIIVVGAFGGLCQPAMQGIISKSVGDDEQGQIQGSLSSLSSLASIIGYLGATRLFAHFVSDKVPTKIPGAGFFASAILAAIAIGVALWLFARIKDSSTPQPPSQS